MYFNGYLWHFDDITIYFMYFNGVPTCVDVFLYIFMIFQCNYRYLNGISMHFSGIFINSNDIPIVFQCISICISMAFQFI
jgi:hypothetical protein